MTITFSQIQVRTMILALLLNVCHSAFPAPGILGKQHHHAVPAACWTSSGQPHQLRHLRRVFEIGLLWSKTVPSADAEH